MTDRPRRFDGDETDAAIDRAVREIMSRDPAPGFRQRVLARLHGEPRAAWTWGRVGMIATASAVVLLLAMWTTRTPQPQPLQPVSEPRRAEAAQPAAGPPPTTPTRPPTVTPSAVKQTPRAVARRTQPSASDRRVTAASIDPVEERLERTEATRPSDRRLENPRDPLSVPPMQVRPLESGEIRVRPMTVGPIVIVPLLPPR